MKQRIPLNQDSGSGDAAGSGDWVAAAALKQMMQYRVKMTIVRLQNLIMS